MADDWARECRLDWIDLLMAVRGTVRRGDLVERFGISPSQASADIAAFVAAHPRAIEYDLRAKCYRPWRDTYRAVRGQDDPRIVEALARLAAAGSRLGWRP